MSEGIASSSCRKVTEEDVDEVRYQVSVLQMGRIGLEAQTIPGWPCLSAQLLLVVPTHSPLV